MSIGGWMIDLRLGPPQRRLAILASQQANGDSYRKTGLRRTQTRPRKIWLSMLSLQRVFGECQINRTVQQFDYLLSHD